MNARTFRIAALAAALVLAAVLPVAASGVQESSIVGRMVAPSADTLAFFQARGVDAQYVGKAQNEVPADQWAKIKAIVASDDASVVDGVHNTLNSLVGADLHNATITIGETVYMVIGNSVWTHMQAGAS
jgi:hypothetical protein